MSNGSHWSPGPHDPPGQSGGPSCGTIIFIGVLGAIIAGVIVTCF